LDRNGTLDAGEARLFIKNTMGAYKAQNQNMDHYVSSVLRQVDKDGDGCITKYEMTLYLKQILESR